MITYAGGINAYEGHNISYPVLSAEGLLYLNPDIIIDMISGFDKNDLDETAILKEWESVSNVEAVKKDRVYIVKNDYAVIPGPRFILLLEDLARIIHPDIKWDNV